MFLIILRISTSNLLKMFSFFGLGADVYLYFFIHTSQAKLQNAQVSLVALYTHIRSSYQAMMHEHSRLGIMLQFNNKLSPLNTVRKVIASLSLFFACS